MRNIQFFCVLAAALVVGCGDEEALVILHHTETSPAQCSLEETREGRALTRGVMDVTLTNTFDFVPLVENSGDQRVQVKGATVSFETPPLSFPLPQGLFVPAPLTLQPGERFVIPLPALPVDVGNIVRQAPEFFSGIDFNRGSIVTVLVKVTMEGINEDGDEVRSQEFALPLDICVGCLISHPPEALGPDPEGTRTRCLQQGRVPAPPCRLGQDGEVDCRLCLLLSDGAELCHP
jgi:hypothetical protein